MMTMPRVVLFGALLIVAGCGSGREPAAGPPQDGPPNILFAISDDQSWPHAGAYGAGFVETPAFDRVAREGILFHNAFVASPGCAPSRGAIVLGRYPWQNGQAGNHQSVWPAAYTTLPDYLEGAGYHVGYTGKGVGPHQWALGGRTTNPAGPEYNRETLEPPYDHVNSLDYAANFEHFLAERGDGQPFFFWYGATEPHRAYEAGIGRAAGKRLDDADLPAFLPPSDTVRSDVLDYAVEVEWFDRHLGRMLDLLADRGELDNTVVIVTSDNGMPFPAAKANAYEHGIHVPLAIRWGDAVRPGREVDDLVSLVDLFPTIFELVGLPLPEAMPVSGRSLGPILFSEASGRVDATRTAVFAARERHSSSRWANLGYPQRAIRGERYLLVRNYRPERWPAGAPLRIDEDGTLVSGYHDVDGSRSLRFFVDHADEAWMAPYVRHALGVRPYEELYDVVEDPACMNDLADDAGHRRIRDELSRRLTDYLVATGDPREVGPDPDVFETHPRLAGIRTFPEPEWTDDWEAAELEALVARVGTDTSPAARPDALEPGSVTLGNWRLVQRADGWALFDVVADPSMENDLSDWKRRTAGQLRNVYAYWRGR